MAYLAADETEIGFAQDFERWFLNLDAVSVRA